MTILLVDDSRPARNILRNSVDELGTGRVYEYLEAENGEDALDLIKTHRVDLVFLDWNMSTKMTGLDVLKEIRKIERCKQLPVIMVTSEIEKTNVIESLKVGANDYIVKPIDWKTFKEKVLKVLRNI